MNNMLRCLALLVCLVPMAQANTVALPPVVLAQLNVIQRAMANDDYPRAQRLLEQLAARDLNPSAEAYVLQFQGNLALAQANETQALGHFARAHALAALPPADQRRLLHTVAQLQLHQARWADGVLSLERWMAEVRAANTEAESIRPEDYLMLAQGQSQLERWLQVVEPARTAIRLKGQAPEDWYRLQLAAHIHLEQWSEASGLLEHLVNRFPEQNLYWEQLASAYQSDGRTSKALATLRSAWLAGRFSRESQYLWLVQLFLAEGVPDRAAVVLETAMAQGQVPRSLRHERLLGQAQIQARRYQDGRETLERIARRKPDYATWRQLAYLDLHLKQWTALKARIEKAMALNPDAADLLILSGIADAHHERYDSARVTFQRAREHEATRGQAEAWLNYLEQVAERA